MFEDGLDTCQCCDEELLDGEGSLTADDVLVCQACYDNLCAAEINYGLDNPLQIAAREE